MCIFDPFIALAMKKNFGHRGDGSPAFTYFLPKDYGIRSRPFSFCSGKNILRGEFYFSKESDYKGLLVFFHGISAGRSSYTGEIAYFAKRGYLVMAYDNTGCMQSEGKEMVSLSQTALDQKAFFAYLDTLEGIRDLPRFAIGHSWGGYGAFLALQKEYKVQKAVSVSGFFSFDSLIKEIAPQYAKLQPMLRGYVKRHFGEAASRNVLDIIAERNVPALYIQGDADPVVPTASHMGYLQKHKNEYPSISLYVAKGRRHQAFWSVDAQNYFTQLFGDRGERNKGPLALSSVDFVRLTQDDPKIMKTIIDFLEK